MDFVNKIVCSFTTKHPGQNTVPKSWHNVRSDRRFACSNNINLRILARARKRLLVVLHRFSIYVVNDSLTFVIITSTLTLLLDFTLFFYHKCNFAAINVWPQEHNLKFGGVFHHIINSKSIKNQMRAIR